MQLGDVLGKLFVIYNEGVFPWQETNNKQSPFAGLKFEAENGKISVIDYMSNLVKESNSSTI